jgi:hypothetical protein
VTKAIQMLGEQSSRGLTQRSRSISRATHSATGIEGSRRGLSTGLSPRQARSDRDMTCTHTCGSWQLSSKQIDPLIGGPIRGGNEGGTICPRR